MSQTDPQFSIDQLAAIEAAYNDVTGFAKRRAVEAIIKSDKEGYNSGLNKLLEGSPARFLDLLKMLITSEREAKDNSKPTTEEALALAAAAVGQEPVPLKLQAQAATR